MQDESKTGPRRILSITVTLGPWAVNIAVGRFHPPVVKTLKTTLWIRSPSIIDRVMDGVAYDPLVRLQCR